MAFLLAAPAAAQVGLNVDVESAVRAEFADAPVMIEIARCESKFRQYTDAGNPLYGGYQGKMVGIFQVYSDIHRTFANSIGMDIQTTEGNIDYARHLYLTEGTRPWLSSMPCWGKETNDISASHSADTLTMNLSLGMEHPQVLLLQKTLNAKGYVIAEDGPGSPGNETQMYGSLTRAAVKRFQCEQLQICDGDEHTNGYGFVGAKTRAALAGSAVASAPVPASAPASSAAPAPVSEASDGYSAAQFDEIEALKAQILALQAQLATLLADAQ